MTWRIVSPALTADHRAVIVEIDVPFFTDETDYEEIMGRAFSSPADQDRLASGMLVVLATSEGLEGMKMLSDTKLVVPVREVLVKLALKRQIVALRWAP